MKHSLTNHLLIQQLKRKRFKQHLQTNSNQTSKNSSSFKMMKILHTKVYEVAILKVGV